MSNSHWYDSITGKPVYTIIGKNGKERATTLRDAKTHGYFTSVTTAIQCANKKFLNTWKEEQILDAASSWPYTHGECIKKWKQQIRTASKQQTEEAIKRGHEVHDMLEQAFKGDKTNSRHPIVKAVKKELKERYGNIKWEAEAYFAHPLGFGGKCDLHSINGNIVADFKTKNTNDASKMVCYDDHPMQLAAYREGFNIPTAKCINIFVSTSELGLIKVIEHSEAELQRGWKMFKALLDFWKLQNKYEIS